ncbi:hemolysin family protein [Rhodopila sp.]|jgi:putative hemolysin|uniref:hemolysin family protein n=1 Tax=Rhodopila sp. TaxID=2480087 RepID=UPI002BF490B8|nr:hemolysin family protein [Rhodopila sp.]HVZ08067.1 hemolysin family protein [Rhodopila sp.]
MELGLEAAIILLLIVLNGLFSLSELALVSARRARLAVLARKRVRGAAAAQTLSEDPQRFLPTVQVGITLISVLTGVFGGARIAAHIQRWLETEPAIGAYAESLALGIVVVVTTFLTLVLGELVPKQLALRNPEGMATWAAHPIIWFSRVSAPVVWLLGKSSDLVLRLFRLQGASRQTITEEELKALLAEGAQTGVLEVEERDIIERVLRLADKPIRAIMTPRTELAWVDRTLPPKMIAATLKTMPYSRLVVCDRSIDNVVGVVQAKDLLDRILSGAELSLGASLKQPMIVPDTVTALDALERLKSDTLGLALVMDEYGSFEGVVTAADVLEAIVGDASGPEHQEGVPGPEGETTLTLDGMTPVDELKARLDLPDLPAEGSYHTLAGLLLALLRRVPRAGDRIVFGGWRFEVLEMDGRRVETVLAGREPAAETADT